MLGENAVIEVILELNRLSLTDDEKPQGGFRARQWLVGARLQGKDAAAE